MPFYSCNRYALLELKSQRLSTQDVLGLSGDTYCRILFPVCLVSFEAELGSLLSQQPNLTNRQRPALRRSSATFRLLGCAWGCSVAGTETGLAANRNRNAQGQGQGQTARAD